MIPVQLIKEVRERTGVGVLEAKRALCESGGVVDRAVAYVRAHAICGPSRRLPPPRPEGVIASYSSWNSRVSAIVDVGCESDFVATSKLFLAFADQVAAHLALRRPEDDGKNPEVTFRSELDAARTLLGERIEIRRFHVMRLTNPQGQNRVAT